MRSKKLFEERRESYSRTNADYVEDTVTRMVRDLSKLALEAQKTFVEGLESKDRHDVLECLRRWPNAARIDDLLDESQRCLDKAKSPNGAVAVAGKALDLMLVSLNLPLKEKMLGKKLNELSKLSKRDDPVLRERMVEQLAIALVAMLPNLEIRNAGAHYFFWKPIVTGEEAGAFLDKVRELVELEKRRSEKQANLLERHAIRARRKGDDDL